MRSVKTRILVIVISCIVISSLSIGSASIINSKKAVEKDSVQIMNLLCEEKSNEINSMFSRIEQSVNTLTVYAAQQLDDFDKFKTDDAYVEEYANSLISVAVSSAENTEGALTVYIRFNPKFTDPESGFFCGKEDSKFQMLPPTNLQSYGSTDITHVGWFYEPVKEKTGTWMMPYYNENIKKEILTYAVPYYVGNELVGVVGMDIDFGILQSVVGDIKVYKTGYSFLTDEKAKILYHQALQRGTDLMIYNSGEFHEMAVQLQTGDTNGSELTQYTFQGIDKKGAFRSLINGMRLVLTAPTAEIEEQAVKLIWQIVAAVIVVIILAVIFTVWFTRRLVKPLLELTEAAKKIAEGDLSVSITHQSNDEVGALAESFRQTVSHLHRYISYINELAYRDALTGVKNKTAYVEMIANLEENSRLKRARYAVIVFDINGLKIVNDSMGHNFGDLLIINSCKIINHVFMHSPVYRIGGDEFVVLLEGTDYDNYRFLLEQLWRDIQAYNEGAGNEIKISIAWGIALYDEDIDLTYEDVFRRADNAMYRNKENMKRETK